MTKRLHSKTYYDDTETLLRDAADALVDGVANRVRSTPSWICMQQAIERVWRTYEAAELERRMLFYRFPGGSKKGRKIIKRDFDGAFERLMHHYFVETPLYPAKLFSRRFRVSRAIFERVYDACVKHPFFQHAKNRAGRRGIHPLVKVTACFRHIAYGTSADQLDEHFQISETTFLETRIAFCDVEFCFCECLMHVAFKILILFALLDYTSRIRKRVLANHRYRFGQISLQKARTDRLARPSWVLGLLTLAMGKMP